MSAKEGKRIWVPAIRIAALLMVIIVVIILIVASVGPECHEFILPDGTVTGCGEWR